LPSDIGETVTASMYSFHRPWKMLNEEFSKLSRDGPEDDEPG